MSAKRSPGQPGVSDADEVEPRAGSAAQDAPAIDRDASEPCASAESSASAADQEEATGAGDAEGAGAGVKSDLDELVAAAAERDEYLALAQRTQADFENYRKRMAREVAGAEARGTIKLARELLPALDNLERALAASASSAGDGAPGTEAGLADGIRLVQSELMAALARLGIEAYSPAGESFDPELHEAMAQHPVDGVSSGTIVEVYQPGYRLGESVIRPARVVVAA